MKQLLLLLALFPSTLFAQNGFTITGKIEGISDGEVKITSTMDQSVLTTGTVKAGAVSVKGSVPEPGLYWLVLGKEQAQHIYLENKPIKISGNKKDLKNLKVEGSASHKDFVEFRNTFNPLFGELNGVGAELQKATNAERRNRLSFQYDSLVRRTQREIENFVTKKKSSYVAPFLLFVTSNLSDDIFTVERRYNLLDEKIRNSEIGKSLAQYIEFNKFNAVGTVAADFTQNDLEGKPVSLSSFKGKYVLVDFWASWCRPCRIENPNVVKAYNKFKDKNFTILGISLDESKDAWVKAIEKDNLTWTHISDLQAWNNSVAQLYRVQSIPQNYLIGPDGKILAKDLRAEDLEKKLCELLGCN
jgi:peroxiredoxin